MVGCGTAHGFPRDLEYIWLLPVGLIRDALPRLGGLSQLIFSGVLP